jgi:NitT/TauT family transport system substrate-binding protein
MKNKFFITTVILLLFLTSCSKSALTSQPTTQPISSETPKTLVPVRLPVGYIPNIQFAPLYVAIEKGFYSDAGLDVSVDYSMENDNAILLATDEIQFAILSGEQVLLGRAKQLPIIYVMAWYQQFPVGIVSKSSAGIKTAADLKGKKLGLPGLYGASYIGAIALLDAAGLKESDVQLDSIGYNQVEVLMADREDAVVVYVSNEPIQLENLGQQIDLLKVSDAVDLVGNGLVTNEKTLAENPELVKAMTLATLKGIEYTIAHPDEAFEISKKYIENLASADQKVQKEVLAKSIEQWKTDRPGFSKPVAWNNMQNILLKMGLVTTPQDLSKVFTNEFIP